MLKKASSGHILRTMYSKRFTLTKKISIKALALFSLFLFFSLLFSATAEDSRPPFDYRFYPIGWSADGKLAYVVYKEDFDGYGSGTDYHFYLQDLITDAVLESRDFVRMDEVYSIAEVMEMESAWYAELFSRYRIDTNRSLELESFPVVLYGSEYTVSEDSSYRDTDDLSSYIRGLEFLELSLVRTADSARKMVHEAYYEGNITTVFYQAVKSPFENRIALVLYLGTPGWEGIPLQAHISVIGSNLNVGFRKN